METGFPSSDDAEESTITRYNATVAGLANLCHCMDTPGFPLPRFHFSQLAHLPFEWPMARLSIDFPSIAASFPQNVSRLAVEKTPVGNGSQSHGLKLPVKNLLGRPLVKLRQSLLSSFTALVLLKCYIDFRRGSILSLRNFGRKPFTLNWLESVMT